MGLETGSYLDDLVITNPVGPTDERRFGDDHLRLIKTTLKNTFHRLSGRVWRKQEKSEAYQMLTTDNMSLITCTDSFTLSSQSAGNIGNGWMVLVLATGGDVVLNPAGDSLIAGAASVTLKDGQAVLIFCDGTAFDVYGLLVMGDDGAFNVYNAVNFFGDVTIDENADFEIPEGSIRSIHIQNGTIRLIDLNEEVLNLIGGSGGATPYATFGLTITYTDDVATMNATKVIVAEGGTGEPFIVDAPIEIEIDKTVSGPVVGGRDKSAAFTNSDWKHNYYIYNPDEVDPDVAIAGIVSERTPAQGGPVNLPTGYTHWAYAGPNYQDSSGDYLAVAQYNDLVFHLTQQKILTSGTAGTSTSVNSETAVPPNATSAIINLLHQAGGGSPDVQWSLYCGVVTNEFPVRLVQGNGSSYALYNNSIVELPNISQQFFYKEVKDTGSGSGIGVAEISIVSFRVEN